MEKKTELNEQVLKVAAFMGLSPSFSSGEITGWQNKYGELLILGDYVPYADMNELMTVVERILDIKFDDGDTCYLRTFGVRDENGFRMVRFNRHALFSKIRLVEALWDAVVDVVVGLENKNELTP